MCASVRGRVCATFLNRCGRPRYIFLDNYNVRVGSQYAPPNYPTNDLWVQAVLGWTEYLGSRLLNEFRFADGSYPRFVTNSAVPQAFGCGVFQASRRTRLGLLSYPT
jgi:hypothetical protein